MRQNGVNLFRDTLLLSMLSIGAMDEIGEQNVLEHVLYNTAIAYSFIEYSSLKDACRLFFVDTTYYRGFYDPMERLYKERVPKDLRDIAKNFDIFVKMFCTCNDWISNRSIPNIVRKKLLPFYVQYHCQDYHIPVLERLGIVVEDRGDESGVKVFRQVCTNDFLFRRSQEDVFDEEKIAILNLKLSDALKKNNLRACFQALMDGADVNSYSRALANDEEVNVLCKMFTKGSYGNQERALIVLLLYAGATISSDDTFAHLPLSIAARKDDVELVRLLLKNGVDPRVADSSGATSLHWLCTSSISEDNCCQKLAIAKLLLEYGANIYAKNDRDMDAHMCFLTLSKRKCLDQEALWTLIRYFVDCKSVLKGYPVRLRGFGEFPLPNRLVAYE